MLIRTLFFTLFISITPLFAMLKKAPKPLHVSLSDIKNPWPQKFNTALQQTPTPFDTNTLSAEENSDTRLDEKNICFCLPMPKNIYADIIQLAHLYCFKKEALLLSISEKPSFTEDTFNAWKEEYGKTIVSRMPQHLCYVIPQKIYYTKPQHIVVCTLLVDTRIDHQYHFYFSLDPKEDSIQYIASEKFEAAEFFDENTSTYKHGPEYMYKKIHIPKAKNIAHSVLNYSKCPFTENDSLIIDTITESSNKETAKKCLIM